MKAPAVAISAAAGTGAFPMINPAVPPNTPMRKKVRVPHTVPVPRSLGGYLATPAGPPPELHGLCNAPWPAPLSGLLDKLRPSGGGKAGNIAGNEARRVGWESLPVEDRSTSDDNGGDDERSPDDGRGDKPLHALSTLCSASVTRKRQRRRLPD